jgi:arsenate reductase
MHWSFRDPAAAEGSEEEKLAVFREVRDQIEKRIKDWVAEQA